MASASPSRRPIKRRPVAFTMGRMTVSLMSIMLIMIISVSAKLGVVTALTQQKTNQLRMTSDQQLTSDQTLQQASGKTKAIRMDEGPVTFVAPADHAPQAHKVVTPERATEGGVAGKTSFVSNAEQISPVLKSIANFWSASAFIIAPVIFSLMYCVVCYNRLKAITITVPPGVAAPEEGEKTGFFEHEDLEAGKTEEPEHEGEHALTIVQKMNDINKAIADGAWTFMVQEAYALIVFIIVAAVAIGLLVSFFTAGCFVIGALSSLVCGFIGMSVATYANVRCTYDCWKSLGKGFHTAIDGGALMGFIVTSVALISFYCVLVGTYWAEQLYHKESGTDPRVGTIVALAGFGMGASAVALFARVGGGIFTKAADIAADLSGKNEYGLDEDDPRNPACIADNVGDNVGDIAGMGADLFGSFAEATVAATFIWAEHTALGSLSETEHWSYTLYPVILSSVGLFSCLVILVLHQHVYYKVEKEADVEPRLKRMLFEATVLQTLMAWLASYIFLPAKFEIQKTYTVDDTHVFWCAAIGLWAGALIGLVTEYYTSHAYGPVREMAEAYQQSASTGLILGYALGFKSTLIPLLIIAATITVTHTMTGMFGVAIAAIGMLSTLAMGLTIDAYGPVADNAGGIAEMSGLGPAVRRRTDCLDAGGNTTAAVGKGFAIGSAALVATALYSAFVLGVGDVVYLNNKYTFLGLLIGAGLPFIFAAMLMTSVARAAQEMLTECFRQFPKIVNEGAQPDYERCIVIATRSSLREMIVPGSIVVAFPLLGGFIMGANFVSGMLVGILLSGLLLAIAMSNSGGAYDNAKKYIEAGGLGVDQGKGSAAHKNAVVGDTLGDPLKDTAGPALNILLKLSAVTSLTFYTLIKSRSQEATGDPIWAAAPASATPVQNPDLRG